MTTSNEHNNAPAVPQGMRIVPIWLLERVERSLGAFTSDEGWAQTDMDTMDSVSALIAATPARAPAQDEPFGHFRVEPFGWTDCAKDDEGAIALYERPQEVGLTDEGRQQVFIAAERRMVREPNLSWRDAIVDEVIEWKKENP